MMPVGLKDIYLSRDKNVLVYEIVFENENLAKMAKDFLKQNMDKMLPVGMDKLAKEVEISQEGNKIIQKYVMKDEKTAECLFYLMKQLQEGG